MYDVLGKLINVYIRYQRGIIFMRRRDEFEDLNREKKIGDKILITILLLAVVVVGVGSYGKMQKENSAVTMPSEIITTEK